MIEKPANSHDAAVMREWITEIKMAGNRATLSPNGDEMCDACSIRYTTFVPSSEVYGPNNTRYFDGKCPICECDEQLSYNQTRRWNDKA